MSKQNSTLLEKDVKTPEKEATENSDVSENKSKEIEKTQGKNSTENINIVENGQKEIKEMQENKTIETQISENEKQNQAPKIEEKVNEVNQEEVKVKKEANNEKNKIETQKNINESTERKQEFLAVKKEKKKHSILSVFSSLLILLIVIVLMTFAIFTVYNIFNTNIIKGVHIKGIDVSGMSPSDAKYKIDNYVEENLPDEIKVTHGDFEATISLDQMDIAFDTKNASNSAFKVGRQGNIFENNVYVLSTMFGYVNVEPKVTLNKELLTKNLEDLSGQLPDKVIQSSYYTEGNQLIITSGKEGNVVDTDATIEAIRNSISTFSCNKKPVELIVKKQEPDKIDIEKIYKEVKKDAKDAYYTRDPFCVYPSENGVDFNISLDEAKNLITAEKKEEYNIPLKILYPSVTTNMIGTEAFPDMLSTFSTNYPAANRNRTTNLILAANKINGTVLMPGETFSYNKVVGARTISAGYKEAPIYVQGKVENGLGGGICQIASTLYNAVVYANLEVVQRSNHQFVPTYVTASRDATVVYGALDFQFKNNRKYPIKVVCSVGGGVANFQIFGLKQDDDCQVQISSYETGRTATAIYSEAYKILTRDGQKVGSYLLSKDTYKRH